MTSPRRSVLRRSLSRARSRAFGALALLGLALLGPAATGSGGARAAEARADLCRRLESGGEGYVVCTVDLRRARPRLFWRGSDGHPYATLDRLAKAQGGRLLFAMNAGMYHPDLSPVGLYVEEGREWRAASTADGPGNFHLKPNGVFYLRGDRAGVLETGRYLRLRRAAPPDFATQSGPMLVIDGRIHPKISAEGPSRKVRNGVGVRDEGRTAIFVVSDGPVSFGAFARLFRDDLGCPDALFLDGSVSSLYAPDLARADANLRPLGPMVGVLAPR